MFSLQQYLPSSYYLLPEDPGIYIFSDGKNNVLYVGKARNLKKRVSSYFTNKSILEPKTSVFVSKVEKIKIVPVSSEIESLLLEANYIKKYNPIYNIKLTDGKAYPLIRITTKDKYPKVLQARKIEDQKSIYFGPYPNAKQMRMVLRIIRKIFPFQSSINHPNKTCLYNHLGLCPCPSVLDKNVQLKTAYKKDIRRIIQFLNGNVKNVTKDLEKERDKFSFQQNFEKANEIQKKLDAIELITAPVHKPFEYELNPNLKTDLRKKEINELILELNKAGVSISSLERTECFDISNTSGKHAVGSMVVFIRGEKDSSLYRRFKIYDVESVPNDVAMMQEVLERRLKHKEWDLPDLIIVDGGKGQISAVLKIVIKNNLKIPVIGLAKKQEIIITSNFKMIYLPRNSEALHLIMRIRDEAHRFAVFYHRKLRSKFIFG